MSESTSARPGSIVWTGQTVENAAAVCDFYVGDPDGYILCFGEQA